MILADTSIKRPVTTAMAFLAIALFGVLCYRDLGVDEFPDVEFPTVTILCVYRGASPETIETKIVEKIEEQIAGLSGIDTIRSACAENIGQIIVTFKLDRNVDLAAQDVRDKISAIRRDLPEAMDSPVVDKLDTGAIPIMTITISGSMPTVQLTRYVKDIVKPRIQSIAGVGAIKELALRDREIKIWIDNDRLNAHHLTVAEVVQAVKSKNVEVPAGKIEDDRTELVVKTMGELVDVDAFRRLTVATVAGTPITLGEVADVEDGMQDERKSGVLNGHPVLALQIQKQSGANVVKVARESKRALADLIKDAPAGVEFHIPMDSSPYIEESIHSVLVDIGIGAALAVLIILVFLRNLRSTLISALAIPSSLLASFVLMRGLNLTLNILTTMALSLSIGLLIDDAIVVIENIYRHLRLKKTPAQAAGDATEEIGLAVTATTFSLVAVFVPVALMGGMVGRFLFHFGITVTATVLVSLAVSFTLTPMLAARYLRADEQEGRVARVLGWVLDGLDLGYRHVLSFVLHYRIIVAAAGIGIVVLTGYLFTFLTFEMKGEVDKSLFLVNFRTPIGTSLEGSKKVAVALEHQVLAPIASYVDSSFTAVAVDAMEDPTRCMILVTLVDKAKRPGVSQRQLKDTVRRSLVRIPGIERTTVEDFDPLVSGMGGANQSLSFALLGPDLGVLDKAADDLKDWMKQQGGYVDITDSREPGKPELHIQLLRERMEVLGVNVGALATTLNLLVGGEQAVSQFKEVGKQYDVKIRLKKQYRESPESLADLMVRTTDGAQTVSLSNVSTVTNRPGPARINRYNRARQISLGSNLEGKAQGTAMQEVLAQAGKILPPGYRAELQGMSKSAQETVDSMLFAVCLAAALVYMLLASQFENLLHPLTIMTSVPLGFIGAVIALLLVKARLDILTMIGFMMLMGLVVKNGILLIEFINQQRTKGLDRRTAILTAGPIRLRPILMTSACMIGGMIPAAISSGPGAEMRASMAIAVIGGLITSTALTLLFVPVVYELLEDLLGLFGIVVFRAEGSAPEAPTATAGDGEGTLSALCRS